ncbi:unnamed protein product [Blepharisma stoltei]|uniref:Ankyrin repeat protein n=1 Tax=Blepharisma stoltei TaxID=1481888 RepID=A0AAU9J2D8_9CILI|nr:unnamed protein product [Blepharisma stoltei]
MGCAPCKRNQLNIKDTRVPNPKSLNRFEYWYQIFDFLEFEDLLKISSVCKIFHEQTAHPNVINKFKSFGKNWRMDTITECQNTKTKPELVIYDSFDSGHTPGFLSPNDANRVSSDFKRETQSNLSAVPNDPVKVNSLDTFLPANSVKGMFLPPISEEPNEKLPPEYIPRESATFVPPKAKQNLEFLTHSRIPTPIDPDPNDFDSYKESIWNSVKNCNISELQSLLSMPHSITFLEDPRSDWIHGAERVSLLAVAVSTCYLPMVKTLVERIPKSEMDRGYSHEGFELGNKFTRKISPLQLACARGLHKILKILLDYGSSPHLSGTFQSKIGNCTKSIDMGAPPILICANIKFHNSNLTIEGLTYGNKSEDGDCDYCECLRLLLEASANPNIEIGSPVMPTPIFAAINDANVLKILVKAGADPNRINEKGHTPLYVLCEKYDNVSAAQALVEGGALVDPPTCRPLYIAISTKHTNIVKFLRTAGALINGSETSPSALQVAISANNINMCRIILGWPELNIDWKYRQNGKNMFHRIAQNQGSEIFDLLMAHRSEPEFEIIASALNDSTFADPSLGDTIPLFFALNDLKLAKKYLDYGSNINRLNLVKILASNPADKVLFQFLVENGIDYEATYEGKSAIVLALEKGRLDWIDYLKKISSKQGQKPS